MKLENWKASVTGTDFISVLSQLLCDGDLRDAFAAAPAEIADRLGVFHHRDRSAVIGLPPQDLEFQAEILLRKRFGEISRLLPVTCARLNDNAWPLFRNYARRRWPDKSPLAPWDALGFCKDLAAGSRRFCEKEKNRIAFVLERKVFALHFVAVPGPRRIRRGLQILARSKAGQWREVVMSAGF